MDALCFKAGIHGMMAPPIAAAVNAELRVSEKPTVSAGQPRNLPWRFSFRHPLRSLWPAGNDRYEPAIAVDDAVSVEERPDRETEEQKRNENWVLKILRVNSIWTGEGKSVDSAEEKLADSGEEEEDDVNCGSANEECDVCGVDDEDDSGGEGKIEFDRESFSKLLHKVPLDEAIVYAKLAYLGNLAYSISEIKPENLQKYHGLRFITSSLEKKQQELKAESDDSLSEEPQKDANEAGDEPEQGKPNGNQISASIAYQIAASAASYLHSHTKTILRFKSPTNGDSPQDSSDALAMLDQDMASLMATDSVTAVVAAKEEVKQAVADDLNSTSSSPCDWFICDDDRTATRFFVIQGSESLASWQANLLFEPIQFEGLDVLVHRGIYEAGKGIYEQMLPEVEAHLDTYGKRAKFRFTGHSLGGSLSLVINLMLLIRGVLPHSSLLPVITFGAPAIMCGGDRLLRILGLPQNHVQSIAMHRDIVPRAFSCHYPRHVAEFLKAVNGNFRSLPCLNNQKLLYAPIGEMLILQPEHRISPNHELLPSGVGLYLMSCGEGMDGAKAAKVMRAALFVFMNSPHPLEILSDRAAYGSGGKIQRDHDMKAYLKSVRNIVRQERSRRRKAAKREPRRLKIWWPIGGEGGIVVMGSRGRGLIAGMMSGGQANLSGIIRSGGETLRTVSRFVVSQRVHLLLVLVFPAKLLIVGMYNFIKVVH